MKSTKYFSNSQESFIADYLGWTVVSGSGAVACKPGDIQTNFWLGECKTHTVYTDKITFKMSHWKKIQEEAFSKFKKPVLFTDTGRRSVYGTWCIVPASLVSCKARIVFPYKVSSNIIFSNDKLLNMCSCCDILCEEVAFIQKDDFWDVCILTLSAFKAQFGVIQ